MAQADHTAENNRHAEHGQDRFATLIQRAARSLARSEREIILMLADACGSARNNRLALAQMERFELATRPSWAPRYQSQHDRFEAEAGEFAVLGALIAEHAPPLAPQLARQPSLFEPA